MLPEVPARPPSSWPPRGPSRRPTAATRGRSCWTPTLLLLRPDLRAVGGGAAALAERRRAGPLGGRRRLGDRGGGQRRRGRCRPWSGSIRPASPPASSPSARRRTSRRRPKLVTVDGAAATAGRVRRPAPSCPSTPRCSGRSMPGVTPAGPRTRSQRLTLRHPARPRVGPGPRRQGGDLGAGAPARATAPCGSASTRSPSADPAATGLSRTATRAPGYTPAGAHRLRRHPRGRRPQPRRAAGLRPRGRGRRHPSRRAERPRQEADREPGRRSGPPSCGIEVLKPAKRPRDEDVRGPADRDRPRLLPGGGVRGPAAAARCSTSRRTAGSTCTSRCCRPGAVPRRCSTRSWPATR